MKFEQLTPNLVVSNLARSLEFYRDVLGFQLLRTVPEQPPFIFAMLQRDSVMLFLNDQEAVRKDNERLATVGGAGFYIVMTGIDEYYESLKGRVNLAMPLTKQFYGMREFIVLDPDGYAVSFAQRES